MQIWNYSDQLAYLCNQITVFQHTPFMFQHILYIQLLISQSQSSSQTTDISLVNFLVPENLLGDTSSLRKQELKSTEQKEMCPNYN